MALVFIAIDPETDTDHCPAVFVEEETGDFLFQGWTVTDARTLAHGNGHRNGHGQLAGTGAVADAGAGAGDPA